MASGALGTALEHLRDLFFSDSDPGRELPRARSGPGINPA
jgi:hypothetical protein